VDAIPALKNVADVTVEQFSNVASGSITEDMWRKLAGRISELSRGPNPPAGFVITHGTDTMEETAYFLDLTTSSCAPVVITGAMRQATAVGADGPANLLNAVRVAAAPASKGRGTVVLMNDEIFTARDVTKSNTTRLNAFTGIDVGPAGVTDPDGLIYYAPAPAGGCRPPLFDLDRIGAFPRVDVVYAYIGADSVLVESLVKAGARGLVLAGVGRGGATPSLGRALQRATERGVYVAISSRTGSGRTGGGAQADSLGSLPSGRGTYVAAQNLNPQKARILLMLALAAKFDAMAIHELFRSR
jgi:L-asparaginase